MKKILLSVLALLSVIPAAVAQNTITYGTYDGSQNLYTWGTAKKENYDVAVQVKDAALTGKTITGVRIPINSTAGLANLTAWLSEELTVTNNLNVPDVASKSANLEEGFVTVNFDTPYTLTENGVYVGYSFEVETLNSSNSYPVVVTSDPSETAFTRSTRTYKKWANRSENTGSPALQVLIDGVATDAAGIGSADDANGQIEQPTSYTFTVNNHGSNGVSSIDYTYEIDGQTGTKHADLATPVIGHYNASGTVTFDIPAIATSGNYTLTLKVTKVNGVDNPDAESGKATIKVVIYDLLPTHRTLLEEYTGTWCGYCPRGFAGLETLNELYPHDFIGVSYHNGDPMQFVNSDGYAWATSVLGAFPGFPSAALDRVKQTDAYCGDGAYGTFGIDKTWKKQNDVLAPANISLQAYYTDETKTKIGVKATVNFAADIDDSPYELSYIVTADGLSGNEKAWAQSNYYSGDVTFTNDDMKVFTQGDSYVPGLTFNFVAVAWSGDNGIAGSLPTTIVKGEDNTHTYQFNLTAANGIDSSNKPVAAASIIQDKSKVKIVGLVVNKETGAVINANKTLVYDSEEDAIAGIKSVDAQNDLTTSRQYYTIDGKRLSQPQKGINIVRLANGKTFKVVVK